jgi:dihydrofolate reductase
MAAMSENRIIAHDGEIPWHIPADLKYFKVMTMGKPVIMGRKTFEALGKPLPGRPNIVLTTDKSFEASGVEVILDFRAALERARRFGTDEVFVIGGGEIYKLALPYADRIYLTEVHAHVGGDTYFPDLPTSDWQEVSRNRFKKEDEATYDCSFVILERRSDKNLN